MITYGYFNSSGGDRKYNADQMSEYFDGLITNGVYEHVGQALIVKKGTAAMTVTVGTGRAIIDCKWLKNDSLLSRTITPANALLPRYTAVIVRLDTAGRRMLITTKDGTPASTPTKPTITDNELALAMVYVRAGATTISQADITDTRASADCGWITGLIEQVDTSELFLQWQTAYEEYFADMRDEVEAFYAEMRIGFDQWMSSLTEQLNVNTYVEDYRKHYVLSTGQTTDIALDMESYTYEASDVVIVFINGLIGVLGTDYTLVNSNGAAIRPAVTAIGTNVDIIVLKSKIGFAIAAASGGAALVTSQGSGLIMTTN